MRAAFSCQSNKVSPQNGGFIRETELAPTLFVGKPKPVFMEIDKNLSSSQRNLLNNFLSYWGGLFKRR